MHSVDERFLSLLLLIERGATVGKHAAISADLVILFLWRRFYLFFHGCSDDRDFIELSSAAARRVPGWVTAELFSLLFVLFTFVRSFHSRSLFSLSFALFTFVLFSLSFSLFTFVLFSLSFSLFSWLGPYKDGN